MESRRQKLLKNCMSMFELTLRRGMNNIQSKQIKGVLKSPLNLEIPFGFVRNLIQGRILLKRGGE
ncbi:hypothetical protein CR513_58260 [Mucuna pruriens]|uniref:Uncharacterized protein n=1 Tax=Mucuna pruriens TaxID=157652 RepID=A0A371EBD4_MUCPR|nr:hypothetical protein CR513_58260 [Mucuna pruriens]